MTDNQIFVSSGELIKDMYNDYNIQSDDFVPRMPIWIANAIEELNFIQAYVTQEKNIEFDNHRCQLPWDFKGVNDVIINNVKAILKDSSEFNKDTYNEQVTTIPTYTPYTTFPNNEIATVDNNNLKFEHKPINKDIPYYYINNGWIHTNIEDGIIHLRYKAIPIVFDSVVNMDVPLIYNNAQLKRYLKLYCIKQMLIRGYKHPVLNLVSNNPYTNPAIELDKIRIQTRVACNKFNKDRRNVISTIIRTLE